MMDIQLNFSLKLSLEEMALRRLVINLWTDAYINGETDKKNVETQVSKLVLPVSLKKRMMSIVSPIGSHIREWNNYMRGYLGGLSEDVYTRFIERLCWTSAGTIENKKTAENILSIRMLDVDRSYDLACLHCMEDYIPVFWEELSENRRSFFSNTGIIIEKFDLRYYWAYVMKGEESEIHYKFREFQLPVSFYGYAFRRSSIRGNPLATMYFFHKLTEEERRDILISIVCEIIPNLAVNYHPPDYFLFPSDNHFELLSYLLSLMTPEQQMRIFKENSIQVLMCFPNWSLHDFFLEIADIMWTFLPETKYEALGNKIFENTHKIGPNENLIQNFFLRSPRDFKRIFFSKLISKFLYLGSIDFVKDYTIKVIFKNIDPETMAEFVSSSLFLQLLKNLMGNDEWDFVEFFLQESSLSEEYRQILRKKITSWFYPDLPPPSVFNQYNSIAPPLFPTPFDTHILPPSFQTPCDSQTIPSTFPTPCDSQTLYSPFINSILSQCPFPRYLVPNGSRSDSQGWYRSCRLKRCFDILDKCVVGPVLDTLATEISYIESVLKSKCTDVSLLRLCESYLEQQEESEQVVELKKRVTKWKNETIKKVTESYRSSLSMCSNQGPEASEENSKPTNPTLDDVKEMKETLEAFRDLKALLQEFPSLLDAAQLSRKAQTKEEKTQIILHTLLGHN